MGTTATREGAFQLDAARWAPDPACVLCKRQAGTLTVVLLHVGNVTAVAVQDGYAAWEVATIPGDKALDAFAHPYAYIT